MYKVIQSPNLWLQSLWVLLLLQLMHLKLYSTNIQEVLSLVLLVGLRLITQLLQLVMEQILLLV